MTMPLFESEESKSKFGGFPGSIRLQGYFGEDFHLIRSAHKIEKILQSNGMNAI